MKKSVLFAFLFILAGSFTAFAQYTEYSSSRLTNLSDQLKRRTVDLSDRLSGDMLRGYSSTREDIEYSFAATQLDAAAGLFQQMVRNNRKASELRDAVVLLSGLSKRAPTYGTSSYLWRDVQNSVTDIDRELGGYGNGPQTPPPPPQNPVIGRATWRGMVDSKVQIRIKDSNIETVTIAGTAYGAGTFNFTSALPRTRQGVVVEGIRRKGRGPIRMIQQPSAGNDFTAIIEIADTDSGAKEYEIEVLWREK